MRLRVSGQSCDLAAVWVHLQDADRDSVSYSLEVPEPYVQDVFDPEAQKQPDISLRDYVLEHVAEFGTFIAQSYFENARRLLSREREAAEWVIASVDDLLELPGRVVLLGTAVRFRR